jgi:hypothetical protein
MTEMKELQLNPNLSFEIITISETNHKIIIIDDVIETPQQVIDFAVNNAYFMPQGHDGTYYPGIRDAMPLPYKRMLKKLLTNLFDIDFFPKGVGKNIDLYKCDLSLTTTEPGALVTSQKMPHMDSLSSNDFATVHYFCQPEHGGTSLYKYLPLDIIEINNEEEAKHIIHSVKNTPEEHSSYITGDTSIFKKVIDVEAKFNRMVIYQGNLLHSANVKNAISFTKNIKKGRLTVTGFFCLNQ